MILLPFAILHTIEVAIQIAIDIPIFDPSVQYSIVQASDRLPELVDQAEQGTPIELTRHGKRVAVILSAEEYNRMFSQKGDFGRSLAAFRRRLEVENIDIDPDEVFKDVRDKSPGREVNL